MKIYLDMLFIQNTIIYFFILYIFCRFMNIRISILRISVICCLQSLVNILILVFFPRLYINFGFQMLELLGITKFGLKQRLSANFILQLLTLWIMVICFGGIAIKNNGNLTITLIIFFIISGIIFFTKGKQKRKMLIEATSCIIKFNYNEKDYEMNALVDTGNKVKTIFGESVIFVKEEKLNVAGGDFVRKRTVKYKTLSGTSTNIGVKINNINISYIDKMLNKDAVVITTNNISDEYEAIISFDLLEGGYKNGNYAYDKAKGEKPVFKFFNNLGVK